MLRCRDTGPRTGPGDDATRTWNVNITAKLAHETLKLVADINQTQPADGQETAPASSLDAMPVETLAALNHAGWMKLLMEQDDWRETDDKL